MEQGDWVGPRSGLDALVDGAANSGFWSKWGGGGN